MTPPIEASALRTKLELDPSVIYMLDEKLRIVYCNEAWDVFAAANGGLGLERRTLFGRQVMDAIPKALTLFFMKAFGRVLSTKESWGHNYECSSPTTYRSYRMMVYPNPEEPGLVVVNSLIVEQPHSLDGQERDADGAQYADEHGLIAMCCQCRRARRVREREVWDWVPAYVASPPGLVTHDICPTCLHLTYSECF